MFIQPQKFKKASLVTVIKFPGKLLVFYLAFSKKKEEEELSDTKIPGVLLVPIIYRVFQEGPSDTKIPGKFLVVHLAFARV